MSASTPSLRCVHLVDAPWPLHDAAASRAIERDAAPALAPHALMQRAGDAVARLALALAPHARRIDVLAGPGNNGGDGLVAATALHRHGQAVQVLMYADAARLPADAAWALGLAREAGVPVIDVPQAPLPSAPDLIIDALLGLGSSRAAEGLMAAAIDRANAASCPLLAVDLPSGLHPDSGRPLGPTVRATQTLALLTLKPGLFTADGRDLAGEVWFDDLGVSNPSIAACAQLPGMAELRRAWPRRDHATHKGSYGDVLVIGGDAGMVGAAWLAAHAALAAGAGRVYCSALDEQAPPPSLSRPELMTRRAAWLAAPAVLQATTVVAGCGGGAAVAATLPPLLAHAGRLVLDADALNAVAADPALQQLLRARGARGRTTVLTPHPLEAARLLSTSAADVQRDRLGAAARLAERYVAVVVLKGSGSIIAAPGWQSAINPSGNALLASPGTGDVLAGWIGALWSALGDDGPGAARCASLGAVWLHGRAADAAHSAGQRVPMRALDLVDAMRQAMPGGRATPAAR